MRTFYRDQHTCFCASFDHDKHKACTNMDKAGTDIGIFFELLTNTPASRLGGGEGGDEIRRQTALRHLHCYTSCVLDDVSLQEGDSPLVRALVHVCTLLGVLRRITLQVLTSQAAQRPTQRLCAQVGSKRAGKRDSKVYLRNQGPWLGGPGHQR